MQVRTPQILLPAVWPPPLSLATTRGISVDVFSSPYLDVSVQAVPHVYLFDSAYVTLRWVSPFGNLRISAHLQLPEAYRSLSRPSSAPDAKAFPLRSFMLDLFFSIQTYWFSKNYAGSIFLDQFYPFQQNCNLPKLLVTFETTL